MKGGVVKGGVVKGSERRLSRPAVILFAGLWVALAAVVVGAVVSARDTDRVAAINGHEVTRDELLFHMRRLAPAVQNELRNEYQLTGATDWSADTGGQTALRRLATRALDEIWRDKTTLVLAQQQGLVGSVDHADFLTELAGENESRAKAIANGEVVYGLTEFSPEEYYAHRLTELTTTLRERLSAGADDPLWVSDADVRRAFEADREAWSANATTYTYSRLVVPVPGGAPAGYPAGLQRRVSTADRLAEVAAREPGARLTTGTYHGSGSTGLNTNDQDLMAVLGTLAPGQVSAPVPGIGHITYYQLDRKTVDQGKAFAEYSRRIRLSLVEEKFDQFLRGRIDTSDIDVDTAAVDAINAEDVQL